MTAKEKLLREGYEGVVVFEGFSYDSALVGVSTDNRGIYDYHLMIEWLMREEGFTEEEAVEWIDYNTIRALPYAGPYGPLIMTRLEVENE